MEESGDMVFTEILDNFIKILENVPGNLKGMCMTLLYFLSTIDIALTVYKNIDNPDFNYIKWAKMKILNIELTSIDKTDLGFEHWVDVTYQVPILKNEYTVKLLLLMECKIEDQEVIEYLVSTWKYRDLVLHSVRMYEMERGKKGA